MEIPMPAPYRNDDEAREFLLDHLEAENAELETANEGLRKENDRLKLIARDLLRTPAAAPRPISRTERELEVRFIEQVRLADQLLADARRANRTMWAILAFSAMVYGSLHLVSFLY